MGDLALAVLALHPFLDVEVARSVERDGIVVEQIGHEDEVAIGGELVGDQLGIVESVADHVGDTTPQLDHHARCDAGRYK